VTAQQLVERITYQCSPAGGHHGHGHDDDDGDDDNDDDEENEGRQPQSWFTGGERRCVFNLVGS
jgi:hypothetical protein